MRRYINVEQESCTRVYPGRRWPSMIYIYIRKGGVRSLFTKWNDDKVTSDVISDFANYCKQGLVRILCNIRKQGSKKLWNFLKGWSIWNMDRGTFLKKRRKNILTLQNILKFRWKWKKSSLGIKVSVSIEFTRYKNKYFPDR